MKGFLMLHWNKVLGFLLAGLFGVLVMNAYVAKVDQIKEDNTGIERYSISPAVLQDSQGRDNLNLDCMQVRMTEETLAGGYVEVKYNPETAKENHKYIVWIYNEDQPYRQFQFTLNNFTEWTMMPLPYEEQYIVMFRMTEEAYAESLKETETITNDLGFVFMNQSYVVPVETVCCYKIYGVGDYRNNINCFNRKTVWVYWNDESDVVKKAADFRNQYTSDTEFVQAVADYVASEIIYNDAKLNNRPYDKEYAIIDYDSIINTELGVCSDKTFVFTVMLRSQGLAAQVANGLAPTIDEETGEEVMKAHAWNYVVREDGIKDAFDNTKEFMNVTADYQLLLVK